MASTPKKLKKKMTDLSESVGRSVGKRLSGLVSIAGIYWQGCGNTMPDLVPFHSGQVVDWQSSKQ